MNKRKTPLNPNRKPLSGQRDPALGKMRIIGGKYRGRQIEYSGDMRTRPMKDNIREAVFNLVGAWVPGKHVFDLFAGTGAMGIEALSRGAASATFIERHQPTAKLIQKSLQSLGVEEPTSVEFSDTFFWVRQFFKRQQFPVQPWAVFVCPPYQHYLDFGDEMRGLIDSFSSVAPADSLLVVEADAQFSEATLPQPERWRTRLYSPAKICVLR
ncbi:MAG TPA: RsmD family RNA methyltransferase [Pirellulaceae bacterium]|nr:RsmD family RNA methyltransferase [Pirellulaceae bacterium]HMO91844.1 RsmD family RNA methyltransferase [Pirellulaceae bacterium]HMP69907.1 RsmD family RNA methyltransferase [Pirellulaceae bacterium]